MLHQCVAVTNILGDPHSVRVCQRMTCDDLCYYHRKMAAGLIQPGLSVASVDTTAGKRLWPRPLGLSPR
jgi:hypothetical protein